MARGDGGKTVFENDDDRMMFLSRLGEACGSCGWRVHGYLGEQTFHDRLLDLVDKAKGVKPRQRRKAAGLEKDHGEKAAERIVRELAPQLGLPTGVRELACGNWRVGTGVWELACGNWRAGTGGTAQRG